MLPVSYLASSFSNVMLPNDHGLTASISLASELNLVCLRHPTNHISIPGSGAVQGGGSAKCRVEVEEGGGLLLGFLFCKVLVGTGFSSLQLAKASSTKLEVRLWERPGAGFRADSTVHCYS